LKPTTPPPSLHRFEDQPSLRYGSAGEDEDENDDEEEKRVAAMNYVFVVILLVGISVSL